MFPTHTHIYTYTQYTLGHTRERSGGVHLRVLAGAIFAGGAHLRAADSVLGFRSPRWRWSAVRGVPSAGADTNLVGEKQSRRRAGNGRARVSAFQGGIRGWAGIDGKICTYRWNVRRNCFAREFRETLPAVVI